MGNDEHGPAYPEPPYHTSGCRARMRHCHKCSCEPPIYACPICNGDKHRYMTCEYPGCPDGRDQGRYFERFDAPDLGRRTPAISTMIVGWAVAIAFFIWAFWPHPTPAMDHGFDPAAPTAQWMGHLLQPDYESVGPEDPPPSCCGKADAYQADQYRDNHNGTWTVTITDGADITFPDGTHRRPLPNDTSVTIPASKVNPPKDQAGNPTGHAWIFMSAYEGKPGYVYCFIPLPEGA